MNGLDQFVTSIVEQTIESLHERGLLLDGKIWITLEDLRKHPACLWGRKKVRNLLQNHEIEDIGTNQREYRISAISVYRYLTQKTSKTRTDMNKPPAKRKRNSVSTLSNYP